jgi:bifunctional non-homologous end joining protein LigD
VERKALLKELLRTAPVVRYSEHVLGEGERYFAQAQAAHLEGIIAKRQPSPYVGQRSDEESHSQSFVA